MGIYEELQARGLIAQVTNEPEIREMVNTGKATFYIGFDPTADSLHVGHFMALCLMKRLQMAGNRPVVLVGGGTGYIGAEMCECLRELCRQEQKKEVSILSGSRDSFGSFRLDYYSDRVDPNYGVSPRTLAEKNFRECKHYAVFFSDKSDNLLLSGNPGLGKTFLSACIARTVADRGYSVAYETAGHLFTKMERAKFMNDEQARQETESYTHCDLLILDDLGTEMPGQFTNVALYGIINDRLLLGKPTIISTNLTTDDIAKRYTPQIASRLRGSFKRVPFIGEDIRLMKNGGLV